MPVGFRIRKNIERPDPELIKRFADLSSTDISDVMRESGTMTREIAPLYGPMRRAVGPAVTISIPTASMSVLKLGMDQTQAGDILVVNAKGLAGCALVGANMLRGLFGRGVAAFIADGAVRDLIEVREEGWPVYARHLTTAGGPLGPDVGEVNYPIACGGVVVNPGDIIVADEDGIVAVPVEHAEAILAGVAKLDASHKALQPVLRGGGVTNIDNIKKQLRESGFEYADE